MLVKMKTLKGEGHRSLLGIGDMIYMLQEVADVPHSSLVLHH